MWRKKMDEGRVTIHGRWDGKIDVKNMKCSDAGVRIPYATMPHAAIRRTMNDLLGV
jgi:hypothetical protein